MLSLHTEDVVQEFSEIIEVSVEIYLGTCLDFYIFSVIYPGTIG